MCLKLYSFTVDQHLEHEGKGKNAHRHHGMFCSEQCLAEYCRIVVKSAKTSQMEAAGRAIFKEERRNERGTGVWLAVRKTHTTISKPKRRQSNGTEASDH